MTIPATHAEIEQIYLQSELKATGQLVSWLVSLKMGLRLWLLHWQSV